MKIVFLIVGFVAGVVVTFIKKNKELTKLAEEKDKEKSQIEAQSQNEILEQLEGNLIQLSPFLDNVSFVQFSNGKYTFFDGEENPITMTKNKLEKIKSQEKIVDGEVYVKDMVFKVTHNEEEEAIQSYVPESLSFDSTKNSFIEKKYATNEKSDSSNLLATFIPDMNKYNYSVKRDTEDILGKKFYIKKERTVAPFFNPASIPVEYRIEEYMITVPQKVLSTEILLPTPLFDTEEGLFIQIATEHSTETYHFNSEDKKRTKFLDNIFASVRINIQPTEIIGVTVYSNTPHSLVFYPELASFVTIGKDGVLNWVFY